MAQSPLNAAFVRVKYAGDPTEREIPMSDFVLALIAFGISGAGATTEDVLNSLGIPTFDDLATANASGDINIGKPFYNTATSKLDITTA